MKAGSNVVVIRANLHGVASFSSSSTILCVPGTNVMRIRRPSSTNSASSIQRWTSWNERVQTRWLPVAPIYLSPRSSAYGTKELVEDHPVPPKHPPPLWLVRSRMHPKSSAKEVTHPCTNPTFDGITLEFPWDPSRDLGCNERREPAASYSWNRLSLRNNCLKLKSVRKSTNHFVRNFMECTLINAWYM